MPLTITTRNEADVPTPNSQGRVNEDLQSLKSEMAKLSAGMILEIETGSAKAVRSTKMLVSRAAKELGAQWQHWSDGTKVFARPANAKTGRRGRAAKTN